MRPTLSLAWSASLALLLACATPGPEERSLVPYERVGTADFSFEAPIGRGWNLRLTEFSATIERRTTSWMHPIETILICVLKHPLAPLRADLSERELAMQFLEAEKAILCESEAEEDVRNVFVQERTRHEKKLYQLTYDIHSRYRSDDPAWGDEVLLRKGEIYAYFPDGPRGSSFFCFEIRITHRAGYPERPETLRLIDRVIDSFWRKEPGGRQEPTNLQSQ